MTDQDKEAAAISTVVNALASLDEAACMRVLEYAAKRFAPTALTTKMQATVAPSAPISAPASMDQITPREQPSQTDIKSLKEEKDPANAIQMAVLVAYYLKEVVAPGERADSINTADVTKYFNQARYPLPTGRNGVRDTLANARRSGYLETAGTGQFRLTPVGHNLAAYKMPKKASK